MKRQPSPQFQHDVESNPRDTARCQCGAILQFDTDLYGNVLESCRTCEYRRPMQRVQPRSETEQQLPAIEEWMCPEGCGTMLRWNRNGARPQRCSVCSKARQLQLTRDWQKRNRGRAA